MEFKRIWNIKTCVILLILCLISGLLFYNQQIQNGNEEILQYVKDYDSSTFNILDVNRMYNELMDGWIEKYDSGDNMEESALDEEIKTYMTSFYKEYINKEDASFSIYMAASEMFKEHLNYTAGYHERIVQMREQSANLIHVSAFSNSGSYSYNNILKTRYDMKFNEMVTTAPGGERAVDSIFEYKLTGVFLLLFMIYILYRFFEDKKLGLFNIIYAAENGRVPLTVRRMGILLSSSLIGSLAVNFVTYMTSFILYGGEEYLGLELQSSQTFAYVPFSCNRITFLLLNIIIYGISIFVIAIFAWGMLSIFSNFSAAGAAMLIAGVVSFLCHQYIPESSVFGVLKYTNLLELLQPGDAMYAYSNVRLWGTVYGRGDVYLITLSVIMIIFTSAVAAVSYYRHPVDNYSRANAWLSRILTVYRQWSAKLNPWGTDLYKILIGQKGIIIIIIGFFLICRVQIYGTIYYDGARDIMRNYYFDMNGREMDSSIYDEIKVYENQLNDKNVEYQQLNAQAERGEKVNGSYMKTLTEEINALSDAVDEMKLQADYLDRKKDEGDIVQVISPYVYEGIFNGNMDYSLNMIDLYVYMMLIFLINGSISCERKGSMVPIIRSTANGREYFIRRKIAVNSVLSVLLGFVIYAYYYIRVLKLYSCSNMDSNLHSLMFMEKFPLNITIRQYVVFGFIAKLLVMWSVTMMITLISLYVNEKYTLIICFISLIPHILYLINFVFFQYLSVVLPMNDWHLLRICSSGLVYCIMYVAVVSIGIFSMFMVIRTWVRRHL